MNEPYRTNDINGMRNELREQLDETARLVKEANKTLRHHNIDKYRSTPIMLGLFACIAFCFLVFNMATCDNDSTQSCAYLCGKKAAQRKVELRPKMTANVNGDCTCVLAVGEK